MFKKLSIVISLCLLVSACGYEPMYGKNNDINFYFKKITIKGDNDLKNLIKSYLTRYNNENSEKEMVVNATIIYKKISQTKNIVGETTDYLLVAEVEFEILSNNNKKIIFIKEDFVMKNLEREFDEKNYERTIKQNFAYSIVDEFILRLSRKE